MLVAATRRAMPALLITGVPGVGKTTAILRAVEQLDDLCVAGFVTEEQRDQGRRVGFYLLPFSGRRRTLARVGLSSRHRVGRYGVDVDAVSRLADTELVERADVDLYVVDEIGKMECFSQRFVAAIRRLLDGPIPLLATVALRGGGVIADAKAHGNARVWEVTRQNRASLPEQVVSWVRTTCSL